jgi:hypothetical protein
LRSAAAITPPMRLEIEMWDGNVKATAGETVAVPERAPIIRRRRSRSAGGEGQGSLFD